MKNKLLISLVLVLSLIGLVGIVSTSYAANQAGVSPIKTELKTEDSDKDGYSDLCEQLHKSDPNDSESKPSSNITINVPSDIKTIQSAIDIAIDGDTIVVSQGKYKGNINFNGRTITLTSTVPLDSDVVAKTINSSVTSLQLPLAIEEQLSGKLFAGVNAKVVWERAAEIDVTLLAGVYKYLGGGSWEQVSTGAGSLGEEFGVICFCEYKGELYAGTMAYFEDAGKVWKYDGGTNWTLVGTGMGDQVSALVVYDGNLYAGTSSWGYNWSPTGGKLYRYDGGTTWTLVVDITTEFSPYPPPNTWTGFRSLYVSNITGEDILYIGDIGSQIFGHYDGTNFTVDASFGYGGIWDYEFYNNELYASGNNAIFHSSNGTIWSGIGCGFDGGYYHVSELETFQNYLYMAHGPYLGRSVDGVNWDKVWANLGIQKGGHIGSMIENGSVLIFGTGGDATQPYISNYTDSQVYIYDGGISDTQPIPISGEMGSAIQSLILYDAIPINTCQTLDQPNTTYYLTKDLIGEEVTTIRIVAEGITFDGRGHSIKNPNLEDAVIYSQADNVTIKNCDVTASSYKPSYSGSNGNGKGICISADNNIVKNNKVSNTFWGILVYGSGNIIDSNIAEGNAKGIHLGHNDPANPNIIKNNLLKNNNKSPGWGLGVWVGEYNQFINNKVYGNNWGIVLYGASHTLLKCDQYYSWDAIYPQICINSMQDIYLYADNQYGTPDSNNRDVNAYGVFYFTKYIGSGAEFNEFDHDCTDVDCTWTGDQCIPFP